MYAPQTRIIRHGIANVDFGNNQTGAIIGSALNNLVNQGVQFAEESRARKEYDQQMIDAMKKEVPLNDAKQFSDLVFQATDELKALKGKSAFSKEYKNKLMDIKQRLADMSIKSQQDTQQYQMLKDNLTKTPYVTQRAQRDLDLEYLKPLSERNINAFEQKLPEVEDYFDHAKFRMDEIGKQEELVRQSVEDIGNQTLIRQWKYNSGLVDVDPETKEVKKQASQNLTNAWGSNPFSKTKIDKMARNAYEVGATLSASKGIQMPAWDDISEVQKEGFRKMASDEYTFGSDPIDKFYSFSESTKNESPNYMPSYMAKNNSVAEEDANIVKNLQSKFDAGLSDIQAIVGGKAKVEVDEDGNVVFKRPNELRSQRVKMKFDGSAESALRLIKLARGIGANEKEATDLQEDPGDGSTPTPKPKKKLSIF